jgi:hypothetical protein
MTYSVRPSGKIASARYGRLQIQPCLPITGIAVMKDELVKIRQWAQDRLDACEEPPWATQRYQYLVGLLQAQLQRDLPVGMNVVQIDSARRRSRPMGMYR